MSPLSLENLLCTPELHSMEVQAWWPVVAWLSDSQWRCNEVCLENARWDPATSELLRGLEDKLFINDTTTLWRRLGGELGLAFIYQINLGWTTGFWKCTSLVSNVFLFWFCYDCLLCVLCAISYLEHSWLHPNWGLMVSTHLCLIFVFLNVFPYPLLYAGWICR